MLYLLATPRVYQKLKSIVMQAVNEGRVSSPIKVEEAKRIPYLQVYIWIIILSPVLIDLHSHRAVRTD